MKNKDKPVVLELDKGLLTDEQVTELAFRIAEELDRLQSQDKAVESMRRIIRE
jgi:hypothetical protein